MGELGLMPFDARASMHTLRRAESTFEKYKHSHKDTHSLGPTTGTMHVRRHHLYHVQETGWSLGVAPKKDAGVPATDIGVGTATKSPELLRVTTRRGPPPPPLPTRSREKPPPPPPPRALSPPPRALSPPPRALSPPSHERTLSDRESTLSGRPVEPLVSPEPMMSIDRLRIASVCRGM